MRDQHSNIYIVLRVWYIIHLRYVWCADAAKGGCRSPAAKVGCRSPAAKGGCRSPTAKGGCRSPAAQPRGSCTTIQEDMCRVLQHRRTCVVYYNTGGHVSCTIIQEDMCRVL